MLAAGSIADLLDNDHPWLQEYFNGPRGRSASATDTAAGAAVSDTPAEAAVGDTPAGALAAENLGREA